MDVLAYITVSMDKGSINTFYILQQAALSSLLASSATGYTTGLYYVNRGFVTNHSC